MMKQLTKFLSGLFGTRGSRKTILELENEIQRRILAEEKLEEANKSLGNFAFMAAHDLQEPLRKIVLYGSRLEEGMKTLTDPKLLDYTQKMINSSRRMQQLTKDLLNLALLEKEIPLHATDPSRAISLALEELQTRIGEKHARIDIGPIPIVKGDDRYLQQLFLNLIGNALKFCDRPPVITIQGEERGGKSFIEIRDNGIGMSEEGSHKIFEPFQRLNNKAAYEGSGIGLAICKKIMSIHHGVIRVKSQKGVGSVFTLEFPGLGKETGQARDVSRN
jgi:chemotaxis family two-component system sensor kinase Cph1